MTTSTSESQAQRLAQARAGVTPPALPEALRAWLLQRHGLSHADLDAALVFTRQDARRGFEQLIVQLPATLEGPQRYAMRRVAPHGDWIARATGDERQRELRLRDALGRSLPQPLRMAALDVVPLGENEGGALLITPAWPTAADGAEHARRVAAALATLHTGCATFPARLTATLGLVPTGAWLTLHAPQTGVRAAQMTPDAAPPAADDVPVLLQPGWDAFARHAPDAWQALAPLLTNPAPLVRALRDLPETLLHGSPATTVVHTTAGEGAPVALDDWRQTLRGPGALDLAAFLASSSIEQQPWVDTPGELIETYRTARAAGGRLPAIGERWERELALALLAGAMRAGWAAALAVDAGTARAADALAFWRAAALAGVAALHADVDADDADASGGGR